MSRKRADIKFCGRRLFLKNTFEGIGFVSLKLVIFGLDLYYIIRWYLLLWILILIFRGLTITVTKENKIIAKSISKQFGGKPSVFKYWDDKNINNIDILMTEDRTYQGVTACSTIGLSDYSIDYSVDEKPLGIEIVGASESGLKKFPNILSTCAFNNINTKLTIFYGEIFEDIINMYYPDSDMEHVLFTSPFLRWDLKSMDFQAKKVAWLLAVPISEKEFQFAKREGTEALEDLFEQKDTDIFDIRRKSLL